MIDSQLIFCQITLGKYQRKRIWVKNFLDACNVNDNKKNNINNNKTFGKLII